MKPTLNTFTFKMRPLKTGLETENSLQDHNTSFLQRSSIQKNDFFCQWRLVYLHLEVDSPPAQTHLQLAAQSVDQSGAVKGIRPQTRVLLGSDQGQRQ